MPSAPGAPVAILTGAGTTRFIPHAVAWLIEGGRMVTGTRLVIDGGIALGR